MICAAKRLSPMSMWQWPHGSRSHAIGWGPAGRLSARAKSSATTATARQATRLAFRTFHLDMIQIAHGDVAQPLPLGQRLRQEGQLLPEAHYPRPPAVAAGGKPVRPCPGRRLGGELQLDD